MTRTPRWRWPRWARWWYRTSRAPGSTRRCGTAPGTPPPAGPATGRPRCPPTCPRCGPSRSAGPCAPPRPGRRPSWPTRPATARRCTPRRRGRRSGPRSAWPPAPGTPRAAPSNSAWTASPGCARTWTRRPTCAARPRSGWARTARRSLPNCSDVHHGAGERPGDPGHRLDMSGDKTAELVDVGGLSAHDDVVGTGDVLRLGDAADLADERGHVGGFADFCLDEDVSLHHEVLPGHDGTGAPSCLTLP